MPSPASVFSFLRRFVIALVAVAVIAAGGVAIGKSYGQREFRRSTVIHIPGGVLAPVKPGQPANYLLLGSDVRPADETPAEAQAYGSAAQAGGQRSDVMMVLHVDPAGRTGMLVSFPRDMVVDIPGHGRNLLNAAYSLGGPALVITTLENDFKPLRINHYLEVDFRGFKDIVNAIGHVKLWFPTPVHDPYTGLDVEQPGCVSLNGDQALAYARSRHYYVPRDLAHPAPWEWNYRTSSGGRGWVATGSDVDRIPRQQYFLRTLSQDAIRQTGSNPFAINALLSSTFAHLAHDQLLTYGELTSLAYTFRDLNPAKISMSTIPFAVDPSNNNRLVAKFPDAIVVANALENFTPPRRPVVKPLESDRVSVRVVNGSGVTGAAARVLDTFVTAGFRSAGPAADADRSDYKTQIRYAPGKFAQGYTVAVAVGTLNLVEAASAKNTLGGDVLVIVGSDYDALHHRFDLVPRAPGGPAASTASTTPVTALAPTSTTSTTVPHTTVDTRFVPVDPKTGGPLVGCPSR